MSPLFMFTISFSFPFGFRYYYFFLAVPPLNSHLAFLYMKNQEISQFSLTNFRQPFFVKKE